MGKEIKEIWLSFLMIPLKGGKAICGKALKESRIMTDQDTQTVQDCVKNYLRNNKINIPATALGSLKLNNFFPYSTCKPKGKNNSLTYLAIAIKTPGSLCQTTVVE